MKDETTIKIEETFGQNLLTLDEGARLRSLVQGEFEDGRKVVLDFSGVRVVTSAFLNAAIGNLYSIYGSDVIAERLRVVKMSDIATFALRRVVENSKAYYGDGHFKSALDSSDPALEA